VASVTCPGVLPLPFKRKLALRHPVYVGDSVGQAGLPFGAALARAHRGIALGVCVIACALLPRVALRGPFGQFPRVDDRAGCKTLTWPWWSLEGRLSRLLPLKMAALSSFGVFVLTPQ
jgi:hypothetical protein